MSQAICKILYSVCEEGVIMVSRKLKKNNAIIVKKETSQYKSGIYTKVVYFSIILVQMFLNLICGT